MAAFGKTMTDKSLKKLLMTGRDEDSTDVENPAPKTNADKDPDDRKNPQLVDAAATSIVHRASREQPMSPLCVDASAEGPAVDGDCVDKALYYVPGKSRGAKISIATLLIIIATILWCLQDVIWSDEDEGQYVDGKSVKRRFDKDIHWEKDIVRLIDGGMKPSESDRADWAAKLTTKFKEFSDELPWMTKNVPRITDGHIMGHQKRAFLMQWKAGNELMVNMLSLLKLLVELQSIDASDANKAKLEKTIVDLAAVVNKAEVKFYRAVADYLEQFKPFDPTLVASTKAEVKLHVVLTAADKKKVVEEADKLKKLVEAFDVKVHRHHGNTSYEP